MPKESVGKPDSLADGSFKNHILTQGTQVFM